MGAGASSDGDALLRAVQAADYDDVPVVNSVPAPAPVRGPLPAGGWSRWRERRRRRRAHRRRVRHPERFRVEFTAWASIPWRDRPLLARLADFAVATARAITANPAWADGALEHHRLQFDPLREASEIAVHSYATFQAENGGDPGHAAHGAEPGNAGESAQAGHGGNAGEPAQAAVAALATRVAALDSYRRHLAEIGPALVAAGAAQRRAVSEAVADETAALTVQAAHDELVAADTRSLDRDLVALAELQQTTDPAGTH